MFANGLSKSKLKLYQTLLIFQSTFQSLKKRKIIREDQWNVLYPKNCQTDYEEFDITLIYLIIRNCCSLPAPLGGWAQNSPQINDLSISAFLMRLKAFRNKLSHYGSIPVSDKEFQDHWDDLMTILSGLKYDISKVSPLKTCSLDANNKYSDTLMRSQLELCFDIVEKNSQQIKLLQNADIERKGTTDKIKHIQSSQDTMAREMQILTKEMDQAKIELENLSKDKFTTNLKLLSIYDKISQLERKFDKPTHARRLSICEVHQRVATVGGIQKDDVAKKPIDHVISQRMEHNYLREINLSNNTTLTVESFQNLSMKICNANHFILDRLVLMDCNLNDIQVKAFSKAIPSLERLDLSWNTTITSTGWKALTDAICGHRCSRLKEISVAGCNVTDQDIMALSPILPKLYNVDLSYNNSITISGFKCLSNAIIESPSVEIKEMDISNCSLTDKDLISLADSFVFIEHIILNSNPNINVTGYRYLSDVICHSSNHLLNTIDFDSCKLNDEKIEAISHMLPFLETVDFSGNRSITAKGWLCISNAIEHNGYSKLEKICLSQSILGDSVFKELSNLLIKLKSVQISDSDLSLDGLSHFVDRVFNSTSCKLTEFKLHNCQLTVEHLFVMVPLFRTAVRPIVTDLPTLNEEDYQKVIDHLKEENGDGFLRRLSFRDLNTSDSFLKAVASVISYMTDLDIAGNSQINEEGFSHLAEAIRKQNIVLKSLDLSYCNISDDHMQVLAPIIPHISELFLIGNTGITPAVFTNICRSVSSSNLFILKKLDLSYCNLTDDHLQILANLLPVIEKIHLDGNTEISMAGWKYFSNSITNWSKVLLRELSVRDCNIANAVLPLIFKEHCFLKELDLSYNKTLEPTTYFPVQQRCLERIDLIDCNLVETFLVQFGGFLSTLKQVYLDSNSGMTDFSLKHFADAIYESEARLEYLSFENCNFRDEHIIAFSHAIPLVKRVNLSSNKAVTQRGWENLANAVVSGTNINLEDLYMNECNLKCHCLQLILKVVPSIVELGLDGNKLIMPEDFSVLVEIFQSAIFSKFTKLRLESCNLTDAHLKALAPSLQYIRYLHIGNNDKISEEGLQYVSDSVRALEFSCFECFSVSPTQLADLDPLDITPTPKAFSADSCNPETNSTETLLDNLDIEYDNGLVWKRYQFGFLKYFLTERRKIVLSDTSLTNSLHQIIPKALKEKFSNLRELYLSNTSLVDIDIESVAAIAPQLQILDLSDNTLITARGLKHLSSSIRNTKHSRLEELHLRGCNITDAHLLEMKYFPMLLKGIDLSGNKQMTPSGWKILSESICSNDVITLEKLLVDDCNITKSHLDAMLKFIVQLKEFSLMNNHTLTPSCYSYMSKILSSVGQSSLQKLDFRQESMGDFHIQRMEGIIPNLQVLNLNGVERLSPTSYKSIASVLKNRMYLEELILSNALVTDTDMIHVGEISAKCKSVTFDENKTLTDTAFKNFSKAFKKMSADELEELKIMNCFITDKMMSALDKVIPVLKRLVLDGSRFSPATLYELFNAVSHQQSRLQDLSLSNCNITREHLEAMREGMPLLRYLNLSENPTLTVVDYAYLSNALCSTTCNMGTIILQKCNIGDDHLRAMVEMIASLKVIDLSRNKSITASGLSYICSYIGGMCNAKLEEVYLEACNISRSHLLEMKPIMPLLKHISLKDNPRLLYDQTCPTHPDHIKKSSIHHKNDNDLDPANNKFEKIFDGITDRISFQSCRLTDSQLIEISSFILKIKILDLTDERRIIATSLKSIANTIINQANVTLEELRLCEFDDGESIATSISTFVPYLKVLDLSRSRSLTPNGMNRIAEACVKSDSMKLETLKLQDMNLNGSFLNSCKELLPLLKELDISYNKTLNPSCYVTMGNAIVTAENLKLKVVIIKGCNVQEKHLKEISRFAGFVSKLVLDENKLLTESSLEHFAHSIRLSEKPTSLEKLSFVDCRFNDKHLKALSVMLPYINEIDVGYNKWILKAGIKYISDVLVGGTSKLETVRLHECNINHTHFEGMKGIIDNIKNLDLHHNRKWTIPDLKCLCKLVSSSSTLQSIDLSDCNLKDGHLNVISSIALNVQELNISKNRCITPKGFEQLVNVCTSNHCKLRTFNIAKCNLTSEHLQVIAKMIPFVSSVNLLKNRMITRYGLDHVTESVCQHENTNKLVSINLEDCNLDDFCLKSIRPMIPYLKTILLNRNRGVSLDGFIDFMTGFEDGNHGETAENESEKVEIQIKNCFVQNDDLIDQLERFKAFANIHIK